MARKFVIALVLILGAFGGAAIVLQPPKLAPEVIDASVIRSQALLDRAWQLRLLSNSDGT